MYLRILLKQIPWIYLCNVTPEWTIFKYKFMDFLNFFLVTSPSGKCRRKSWRAKPNADKS